MDLRPGSTRPPMRGNVWLNCQSLPTASIPMPEVPAITVSVVNERDADTWDDFLRLSPSSGPFHTRAWTECLKSERLTPLYLRLLSKEQPIGAIAGVVVDPKIAI